MEDAGQKKRWAGLFVTDLDGTLLNADRKISNQDLRSLVRLKNLGFSVVAATGRSNWSFWKHFLDREQLPVPPPFDYVIFSTGAGLMTFPGGKILSNLSLSPEQVCRIVEVLQAASLDFMVLEPIPRTRYFSYYQNSKNNPDFTRRLRLYNGTAIPLHGASRVKMRATEVLIIVPGNEGERVWNSLLSELSEYNVIRATSPLDGNSCWIEVFPKTVSKRLAVQRLAEKIDVPHHRIGAVGNDYNDEDLLEWVSNGYLMGNGPKEMKSYFNVVATNNNNGVSEAVDAWLQLMK